MIDLVAAKIRSAIAELADEVQATPEEDFKLESFGTARPDEMHFVIRRGAEHVRVTVERVK